MTRAYYRAAAVALLVYDITSRETFEAISQWLEECRANGNPEMVLLLVGNKTDLIAERTVTYEEGENFAVKNGMVFLETSAKTNFKIDDVFLKSAQIVADKINKKVIDPTNEAFGIKVGSALSLNEPEGLRLSQKKKDKKKCCELSN